MRALALLILLLGLLGLQACKEESRKHTPIGDPSPTLPAAPPAPPSAPAKVDPSQTDPSQTDPSQTDPNIEPVDPSQTVIDPPSNGNSPHPPPATTGTAVIGEGKQPPIKQTGNGRTYYVQDAQGKNAASMTVNYKILSDGSATLQIGFLALTDLKDKRVGFPYHKLTIDLPQGDWQASKIVRNGHFRSNYYRIDSESKKRDHFRIVLQALPRGAHFQLEFVVPSSIVKDMSTGFELSMSMPSRQGRNFHFRDVQGKSPAELF